MIHGTSTSTTPLAHDLLQELRRAPMHASLFRAALELLLWDEVASGHCSAEEVARYGGSDIECLGLVLDSLCALRPLGHEGAYRLSAVAEGYLLRCVPLYQGSSLLSEPR
jgi:hypothetical protein